MSTDEEPVIWNKAGKRLDPEAPHLWHKPHEITPERREEILDEKMPVLRPRSARYRVLASESYELEQAANRSEARLRSHIEPYATRERSGPPILGLVLIYVVLALLVGITLGYTLPRVF